MLDDLQDQLHEKTEDRRRDRDEHNSSYESNPIQTDDLRSPSFEVGPNEHRRQIADLRKQVEDLTSSLQQIHHSLDSEKREKAKLITSHNIRLSEMVNQIEELKSSRSIARDSELQAQTEKTKYEYSQDEKKGQETEEFRRERQAHIELERRHNELEKRLHETETENRKYAEEIEILTQRIESQGKGSDEFQNESLISKLNSRISAMKYKEQKLYEENAKLETLYNELRV